MVVNKLGYMDMFTIAQAKLSCRVGFFIILLLAKLSSTGNRMLLSYDDTWKELLYHYEERGCIVEGNKFPPH